MRADVVIMTEGEADETFWTSIFKFGKDPNNKSASQFVPCGECRTIITAVEQKSAE